MTREVIIDSIEEYEEFVNDKQSVFSNFMHDQNRIMSLYRGQKDDIPLYPKLCRLYEPYFGKKMFDSDIKTFEEIETELLEDFKRNLNSYNLYQLRKNDWFFLALGQHYGLPTRLLDWSSDPLVALWFAFNELRKYETKDYYRVVWRITFEKNTTKYPKQKLDKFRGIEVFRAPIIDQRIDNQKAWFSVQSVNFRTFQDCKDDLLPDLTPSFTPINGIYGYDYFFDKIIIPDTEKNRIEILNKLNDKGFNYHFIFPDKISKLCKDIQKKVIR